MLTELLMARTDLQVNIRIPPKMRESIRHHAAANRRSINSQIVHYLDRALAADETKDPAAAATAPGLVPAPPVRKANEHEQD